LVHDLASQTTNEKVTVNNIVTLSGQALKFDAQRADEHLRFVNDTDPSQYVAITKFQKQTDRELVFLMPPTTFASGHFEVANAMNTTQIRSEKSKRVEVAA